MTKNQYKQTKMIHNSLLICKTRMQTNRSINTFINTSIIVNHSISSDLYILKIYKAYLDTKEGFV